MIPLRCLLVFVSVAFVPSINTVEYVHLCNHDGWYFTLNVTSFGHGVTRYTTSDVYLGEKICTGSANNNTLTIRYPYGKCNTSVKVQNGKLVFSNSIHFDKQGTSEHLWSIDLSCSLATDATVEASFYPGYPSSTESTIQPLTAAYVQPETSTPELISTEHAAVQTEYPSFSQEASISPTSTYSMPLITSVQLSYSTKPPLSQHKVKCEVCSGQLCGVVASGTVEDCPFCMNVISNSADGGQTVVKRCANKYECETKWWLDTSDREQCTKYDTLSTVFSKFECHFCCTKDQCNGDVIPKRQTLYTGKS